MRWWNAITLCLFVLAACGDTPPTDGTPTTFAAACAKANDGKRIAVDGYLRFPDSFTDANSVVLRLYETDDFKGEPIGVQTQFGTQANQIAKVADQFKDTDLKVYQANGAVISYGTKVRVSGDVYFPIVAQEFGCSLSNPLVATAPSATVRSLFQAVHSPRVRLL